MFRSARNAGTKQSPLLITSARDPLSLEQRGRQRRYFISMMVRTACFISSIFLPSPYRWIAISGAVLLPYVAVVIANAGRETILAPNSLISEKRRQIKGN